MIFFKRHYERLLDRIRAAAARFFPALEPESLARSTEDENSVPIAIELLLVRLRIFPLLAGLILAPFLNIENVLTVYFILGIFAIETVFWGGYVLVKHPAWLRGGYYR